MAKNQDLRLNQSGKLSYKLFKVSGLPKDSKASLLEQLHWVTERAWGHFPKDFLDHHVLRPGNSLICAYKGETLIGYCGASKKKIGSRTVLYVEFTIVDPLFQGSGIGPHITYLALRRFLTKNFLKLFFSSVEIMLLTPNVRVLSKLAKVASFIYPNPLEADPATGRIEPADSETWELAKELIAKSDNPSREINREGLVLHGSYEPMPWLIYTGDKIPWHHDPIINKFARYYLGYGKEEDREFIVRVKITYRALVGLLFS